MHEIESWLMAAAILGLLLGTWGIVLARSAKGPLRVLCGRALFVVNLLSLGGSSLLAAFHRAEGLAPLGLLAGALVVGMLWERH